MNITFISPIAWDNSGGAHRPVQFARALARRGHRVHYFEIEKSRTRIASENPRVQTLEDLGWDELNLVRAWYGFDYATPADLTARLQANVGAPDGTNIVLCSAPFRPALEMVWALNTLGYTPVYDVLDDISEMRPLGSYCYDDLAEHYLADMSAQIVTLSPRLTEKFARTNRVTMIRDGVDLAPFRAAGSPAHSTTGRVPAAVVRGEITVGFWGTMWEYNLNVPLLQVLTRARPAWQFHFVGAYDLDPARPSLAKILDAPNVHFHPSVTRARLAQYAESFDVCILPTPVTPFNLARDPLKVYEYLACGKPVVSTALTQLEGMPYVALAQDADDFMRRIQAAAQLTIDRPALDAYLEAQTWAKRTDALEQVLANLPPRPGPFPPPPRGAMPGAAAELDRWQAFAAHLERLAADREAHVRDLERALAQSGIRARVQRALGGA